MAGALERHREQNNPLKPSVEQSSGADVGKELHSQTAPNGEIVTFHEGHKYNMLSGEELRTNVPSVTNVLKLVGAFGAGANWGQTTGIEGGLRWVNQCGLDRLEQGIDPERSPHTVDEVKAFMKAEKITVNDRRDKGATRGSDVHDALEVWARTGARPNPSNHDVEHRGYVEGLLAWILDVETLITVHHAELMLGSWKEEYCGTTDLVMEFGRPFDVCTRYYPKRASKYEKLPKGNYMVDLKTSKSIYQTHHWQLGAYIAAYHEQEYTPEINHAAILHVSPEGKYEFVYSDAPYMPFYHLRQVFRWYK